MGNVIQTIIKRILRKKIFPPVLFLVLSVVSIWPLPKHVFTHLPLGTETAATVPLFNVWTVWWNADRASHFFKNYWDAPIFYPETQTFAFSEFMPLSIVAAPIIWITGNRVLAYNAFLLLCLWLNGWTAFHLLRKIRTPVSVSLAGGAMMTLLPLVHSFLGVIQLVPVFGIVLTISALYQLAKKPTVFSGFFLGISFSITYLMCACYGFFLVLALAVSTPFLFGKKIFSLTILKHVAMGSVVSAALCFPAVWGQYTATAKNDFNRPEQYIASLSATLENYKVAPWPSWGDRHSQKSATNDVSFKLFPGVLKTGLMILGIALGLIHRRRRSFTLFLMMIMGVSFLLSFGPNLIVFGCKPYTILAELVPGFKQIRSVFRVSVLSHVSLCLLAAMGLSMGRLFIRRYIRPVRLRKLSSFFLLCVGVAAILEILPPAQPLYAVPSREMNRGWVEWVKDHTPEASVLICVPFPFYFSVEAYEMEARWLYWGTYHHRRLANGYSSFFPESFRNLKWIMADFPSEIAINTLIQRGVNYCVVKADSVYGENTAAYCRFDNRIKPVYRDRVSNIHIYRILPGKSEKHFP